MLDPPDFLIGVHVGFDPAQEVGRLLALAVHQEPAGCVRQADDEDQHDNGRDSGEAEYETPALGARKGRADEVGEGDARGGCYLEGDEHRAPDADGSGLGDVRRRHDYGDADGETEEEPDEGQELLVGSKSLQTGERRVAERDQHEGALASDGVGDAPSEERPEQLPEHNG